MNLIRFNQHPTFWNLMNDFEKNFTFDNDHSTGNTPMVNVKNQDKEYVVEVAAPGLSKDDISIKLENNKLLISSEKKEEKTEDKENYTIREFAFNSFSRTFILPKNIDIENVNADYNNGVLNISLPKKEKETVASREISIK